MQNIVQALQDAIQDLFDVTMVPELARPDEQFGDFATNVALQLTKQVGKNPREIAEQLAADIRVRLEGQIKDVTVAGPGFINLTVADGELWEAIQTVVQQKPQTFAGQTVVTEYSDPNPFKVLHAGHLYTSVVGDAISNLVAMAGGNVHRVNFGGDVGLHVGKTMWAIIHDLGGEYPEKLADIPEDGRAEWMAKCYVAGTAAYEDDPEAKEAIVAANKKVYQLHATDDHESPFAQIYWTCRDWSYDYFNAFYARIGTKFERYYPESACVEPGLAVVNEQLKNGVFTESNGAVVFEGEKFGLHTRVFINSEGIPTYETKDVGLIMLKKRDYNFDRSIVVTANEQEQYMAVVLKAIEQFAPELAHATTHITHGLVKLVGGVKMSSRKGNFLRAVDVLEAAATANREATGREDERAVLAAVKYTFLKNRTGADIAYDPKESVSLLGNSGPYLQYAHARARSILAKSAEATTEHIDELQAAERSLARTLSEYPEVLQKAVNELMPHHVCTYLYELAQTFNRFYEHNRVIGDEREAIRLQLVALYADVLKDGLGILGIEAPEQM